jgi:DNA transformation protein
MKPFRPNAKQTLKSYYQVPADVIEDADELSQWAMKAIECQRRSNKA